MKPNEPTREEVEAFLRGDWQQVIEDAGGHYARAYMAIALRWSGDWRFGVGLAALNALSGGNARRLHEDVGAPLSVRLALL